MAADPPALHEGEDYYWDDDLLVFTALYHLKRGHCCGSGCRHCPYGEASEGKTLLDSQMIEPGRKDGQDAGAGDTRA
ncbi:MAG: hypothetical protein HUU35_09000 [Armatimonadetes bacterium]|nr:hypothetical protein [Armatimonadota bacterium]